MSRDRINMFLGHNLQASWMVGFIFDVLFVFYCVGM